MSRTSRLSRLTAPLLLTPAMAIANCQVHQPGKPTFGVIRQLPFLFSAGEGKPTKVGKRDISFELSCKNPETCKCARRGMYMLAELLSVFTPVEQAVISLNIRKVRIRQSTGFLRDPGGDFGMGFGPRAFYDEGSGELIAEYVPDGVVGRCGFGMEGAGNPGYFVDGTRRAVLDNYFSEWTGRWPKKHISDPHKQLPKSVARVWVEALDQLYGGQE